MKNVVLTVEGMTCQGCAKGVVKALTAVAGVADAQVDWADKRADVAFDESQTQPAVLIEAIEDAGFEAQLR